MEGCLSIEEFTIRASISPHTHDFLELAYITKGSVRHTMGERTAVIHPHQYILVDNGVVHAYSKNGGEEAEGLNACSSRRLWTKACGMRSSAGTS